jgi:hypothetical protein
MSNVVAPFGLALARTANQAAFNAQTNLYYIPSTDNNAYYVGDVVKSLANADGNGVPGVVKITNGTDTPRGFIVGILPSPPSLNSSDMRGPDLGLSQVSIPATKTKAYYVMVVDDPEAIFWVQGDSTGTNQVAANVNKNASLTIAAPGTATYPVSATVINSSTIATTQSLIIRLMGLAQIPGNGFGANATWVGKFNQHELASNTAGI